MTALAYRETNTLTLAAQAMQLLDFGNMLMKSGLLGQNVKSPEAAVAIMVKGMELGLPAMAALNGITVIQGKPTVSPQLMLSLINRSGQLEDLQIATGTDGATVTMKRKGRSAFTAKFGPNEAEAMQLNNKDNYKKQAPVMYQWRAVAACARVVFPDVIDGLYTPEEMGAEVQVDEDGAMTVTAIQEAKPVAAQPVSDGREEMDARMKTYGPKLAARREGLKRYGVTGQEVDVALNNLQPWRESDDNALAAVAYLDQWGKTLKDQAAEDAQQATEVAALNAETMLTPEQRGQLQAVAKASGAATSEQRYALWGYMSNNPTPIATNNLTAEQATYLLDTFSAMNPDERAQCLTEASTKFKVAAA
ncbi:hypothetical protein [Deinococcus sp. QL22]|uniref:hypothetical protein n=1 Tax=Deinococcus sp. QL22 TaxID=2939437 RepID=UPI002017D63D|nr:hypothetical protein [Deinococcus sp. QL22]UQN06796.1 hypothetical protein M1R55_02410 [Deinococcus sp. QL22]